MTVRLNVSRSRAPVDESIAIRLEGVDPGATATVRARATMPSGATWSAEASFLADDAGIVDLARDAPTTGSYTDVDPMGLFWSPRLEGEPRAPSTGRGPIEVTLSAAIDGRAVAETTLQRLNVPDGVVESALNEDGMVGALFQPADGGPHPAVVVLGGSGGGLPWGQASLLAGHGFAALGLAYFAVEGLPPALRSIPLEYFDRAFDWLLARPGVRGDGVGVVGTSRGGELVLMLGATYPRVQAIVAYVPSHVGWSGFGPARERGPSSWTVGGEPVPWLPMAPPDDQGWPPEVPYPITPRFLKSLEDREAEERAAIAVEGIEGRVLLISGREDAMWPSALMAERAAARMAAHGKGDRVQHLCYAGAGHTIGVPYSPTTVTSGIHPVDKRLYDYGGNPADIARARADSWPRVIDFLRQAL